MNAFKKQEDDLLNHYKEEMYNSQKYLKKLTEEVILKIVLFFADINSIIR